jgi:hypothetical protein
MADSGSAGVVQRISADLEGTLGAGAPPGFLTMDMVRAINALGSAMGSGSDRPLS